MKKSILFFAALLSFSICNISTSQAQAVEKGDIIIDGFYGTPNLVTGIIRGLSIDGIISEDVKIKSMGPFGGRAEVLLTETVGLGVDVIYASSSVSWKSVSYFDSLTYNYKVSNPRLRIVPRVNIHFSQNPNFDAYGVFGIGYKDSKLEFESEDINWIHNIDFPLSPIAFRLGMGVRYFITPNFGLNVEAGFGSALFTGGITVKI